MMKTFIQASIIAFAIVASLAFEEPLNCSKSIWENSIDRDLDIFQNGIVKSHLDLGESLVIRGWRLIIVNNTLYYRPIQEAPPIRHAQVLLLARSMCRYSMPNVEFVLQDTDHKQQTIDWPHLYIVFSNAKDVIYDQDILIPYQSFFHFQKVVNSFKSQLPWSERIDKAVWRGSTTGGIFTINSWRFKPRTKMALTFQNDSSCCDIGFTNVKVQATDDAADDMAKHLDIKSRVSMDDMTRCVSHIIAFLQSILVLGIIIWLQVQVYYCHGWKYFADIT
jgi:hypothetical protein